MHIPPPSIDYPEEGASARIRISFSSKKEVPEVPVTAFFFQLNSGLPVNDPLRIEHGDWESFEQARQRCWAIAEELDRQLPRDPKRAPVGGNGS